MADDDQPSPQSERAGLCKMMMTSLSGTLTGLILTVVGVLAHDETTKIAGISILVPGLTGSVVAAFRRK